MATAVLLHGNLRTFFMPTRENGIPLCDILRSSIVEANEADVFAVTDTTDFFLDGTQYFDEAQRAEVEGNPRRSFDVAFHHNVGFMAPADAKPVIEEGIKALLGHRLKGLDVGNAIDVSSDPKYLKLVSSGAGGCTPDLLVQQYLKVKRAGEVMSRYEKDNEVSYDIVFRGRFDNRYPDAPVRFATFDFSRYDVFVPGVAEGLLVYDWASFGTRLAMDISTNLYDNFGYTLDKPVYRCECRGCRSISCGPRRACPCGGEMWYSEWTLAPEYHLHRLFSDNGVRFARGMIASPYRYRQ